jgi:hypothetical protein
VPKVDADKIFVTHLSCDPIFINKLDSFDEPTSRIARIIHTPFILCLGANDPRKSTLQLVHAYLELLKQNNISEIDLYCFTNEEIKSNSWKIINTPYHLSDNTKGKNSIHDNINNHSIYNMMIAKYYKIQSHYIDILQSYDYIVWIDARVLVKNEFIPFIFSMIEKNKKLINYQHSQRNNIMKEVIDSLKQKRYVEQKIINQYQIYKERGFPDQSGRLQKAQWWHHFPQP